MAFSLNSFAGAKKKCHDEKNFPEVTKSELKQMITKKSVFVVDVNSKKSFKKTHIPTAINFASSRDKYAKLLPKDKAAPVVAYCGGPKCGSWKQAAEEACKLGYTNVKHFKGGLKGWMKTAKMPAKKI